VALTQAAVQVPVEQEEGVQGHPAAAPPLARLEQSILAVAEAVMEILTPALAVGLLEGQVLSFFGR
jgi:hypothetical protein